MKIGGYHFLRRLAPAYGPHYGVAAQGCLRGMGLIYVISFWSLAAQLVALSGNSGLMPAQLVLSFYRQLSGDLAPLYFPSVLWASQQPLMLLGVTGLGTLAGLCLLYGFYPWISALISWVCWVSLLQVCQPWMSLPGDALTAETGLILLGLIPPLCRTYPPVHKMGSRITSIILLNALLCKILFSSGLAKLSFGDVHWADGTALYYFFETQPFPTVGAWYLHHLPGVLLKYGLWGMMFIELILPFYVVLPRTFRNILAGGVTLQSLILMLTGHFGFLPLLMFLLAFGLVDDVSWRKVLPASWAPPAAVSIHQPGFLSVLILLGMLPLMIWQTSLRSPSNVPRPWKWIEAGLERVHAANRYALFSEVHEQRKEISIQGSLDGRQWIEYRFRLKPTDPRSLPMMPILHLPRLDQAFEHLAAEIDSTGQAQTPLWLLRLMEKLLVNDPSTLSLFPVNPFPEEPPAYLRLAVYEYTFADPVTRRNEEVWWERRFIGFYGPVFSKQNPVPIPKEPTPQGPASQE